MSRVSLRAVVCLNTNSNLFEYNMCIFVCDSLKSRQPGLHNLSKDAKWFGPNAAKSGLHSDIERFRKHFFTN